MTLATRAVRGAFYVLVGSYANLAIGFVYTIIMARLLAPEHFGVFALAQFFVTLLDARGKLGLDYAFVHRQPTTEQLVATHWVLQMSAAIITVLLVAIATFGVGAWGYPAATAPLMLALAGALMLEAAGTTARAALEKELVFARSTVVITASLFISYLLAIVLAFAGFTHWALAAQFATNALLSTLGFWWAFRRLGARVILGFNFDRALARWLLRFGATLALGSFATIVLLQFDNFLVGTFVGAAALGYYTQAYKVAQWPTGLVTHIVSRAALPTYAKLQDDLPRLAKAFEMTLWLILTLTTPIALAIFVAAPDFLILIYGERWLPSALLLRFLIGYSLLRPLLDDTGALFVALGQPRCVTMVLVTQALALVVAATPLTFAWNAAGTAIGVGVAFIIGIALTYSFVARTIPIRLARVFAPTIVAALGSGGVYFLLTRAFDLNALPLLMRVAVKGGFAAAMFGALVLVLERRAFFERVNYVRQLLFARR